VVEEPAVYDFEARAADYLRQVIEHEEHAANATDANLRVGFLALAQMCRDLAAQMQRLLELLKQREGN
jgi:hypothetical protein